MAALAALLLVGGGCARQHSIESGTWRLTINTLESNAVAKGQKIQKEVEVALDWSKEEDQEAIRVEYFRPASDTDIRPRRVLGGHIIPGTEEPPGPRKVKFGGNDEHWTLEFWGEIRSPRAMVGQVFARGRLNDTYSFTGQWKMVKAQPRAASSAESEAEKAKAPAAGKARTGTETATGS